MSLLSRSSKDIDLIFYDLFKENYEDIRNQILNGMNNINEGHTTPELEIINIKNRCSDLLENIISKVSFLFTDENRKIYSSLEERSKGIIIVKEKEKEKEKEKNKNQEIKNFPHDNISQSRLEELYNERMKNMEKAYERKIELMEKNIVEERAKSLKMKQDMELQSKINKIFIYNPSLKPEKIVLRSESILNMKDIKTISEKVKEIYSKMTLFSELMKSDEDLNHVKFYIDYIDDLLPKMKNKINVCIHWGDLFDVWGETRTWASEFSKKYLNCGEVPRSHWMKPDIGYYHHSQGHIIEAALHQKNEEIQKFNELIELVINKYNNYHFPSKSLDHLILHFNEFFKYV